MIAHFVVVGKPVPKGRPRVTKFGTYTPKSTRQYEQSVRHAFLDSGCRKMPSGSALKVVVRADFPVPSSESKKERLRLIADKYHTRRGDLDNVVKAVLDALNGVAFDDDSCVAVIEAEKCWTISDGQTEVYIMEAEYETP